jgi:hypothetical protein
VHALVLRAFVGPPPKLGMECRHGPGGLLDNRASQLRWGTSQENKDDIVTYARHKRNQLPMVPQYETMPNEHWLPVVGYTGYYEVSDQGRVRSLDRWIHDRAGGSRFRHGRIMLLGPDGQGYLSVNISKLGISYLKKVHDLVLRAFIGPPAVGMIGLHGPLGKLINSLDNLSWGTHSQNMFDRQRDGTDFHRNLTHCPREHLLQNPNLIVSHFAKGFRDCLSCNRAQGNQKRAIQAGKPFNFQAKSDEHYAKIMNKNM